ncbi:hypothetical protein KC356_g9299 [Hortaea werneckii]|nr:hypothetical protein KC356_g9299 [Hortaea werneckii]KAI7343566.1 hypothetical protein KC320_g9234 [Hortaea werneckii]KAI7543459.1 hypothetical protein KC331_g7383 [Hortaea werneckii]
MEHANEANVDTHIKATIIPSNHRDEKSKEEMRAFIRHLSGFQQLPAVIEAAGELMGLKGYGTIQSGPAFGQDVLRIKVCGNTGLNLTIVDLPGIIQVPNDEQDDNDVDTVHSLVDSNEDTTKLKLGFFMMKNPSPKEMQHGVSMLEREQKELTYFSSPPWKDAGLDMTRLGVGSLRMFLQDLLSRHTEREMPKVREEVRSLLKSTEKSISRLGEERPTTSHRRMFLSRLAMRYHNLTNAALIGDYDSSEFEFFNTTSSSESRRLRAFVHSVNTTFSDKMRLEGTTLKVVSEPDVSDEDAQILDLQEVGSSQDRIQQMSVSDAKYTAWIRHIIKQVNENLATHMSEAEKELQILVEDEQRQPITYNHYYTDNIQEARQNASRDLIHKIVKDTADDDFHGAMHISHNGIDVKRLVGALQKRVIVDMDEQACSEVRAGLDAYYKVARKTFVDNVCKQIIERHLLRPLPNLFSPETVAAYTEDDLGRVAAESDQAIVKRRYLLSLHGGLMESLAELNHP